MARVGPQRHKKKKKIQTTYVHPHSETNFEFVVVDTYIQGVLVSP